MYITDKAKALILIESKTWLSEKLGITRATLDSRLTNHKWKESEIYMIKSLYK